MKRKLSVLLAILAILVLVLLATGCAQGEPAANSSSANVPAAANEGAGEAASDASAGESIVANAEALIGFTASQTGSYTVESTNQINGLNLCMEQIEESGGVELADGTRVTFASRTMTTSPIRTGFRSYTHACPQRTMPIS
jgi:hypothetical protein